MQTVLKTIISKFNNEFDKQKFLDWFNETKEDFLEDEKSQTKDAYNQGFRDGEIQEYNSENDVSQFDDAENYYNNTFKND